MAFQMLVGGVLSDPYALADGFSSRVSTTPRAVSSLWSTGLPDPPSQTTSGLLLVGEIQPPLAVASGPELELMAWDSPRVQKINP